MASLSVYPNMFWLISIRACMQTRTHMHIQDFLPLPCVNTPPCCCKVDFLPIFRFHTEACGFCGGTDWCSTPVLILSILTKAMVPAEELPPPLPDAKAQLERQATLPLSG